MLIPLLLALASQSVESPPSPDPLGFPPPDAVNTEHQPVRPVRPVFKTVFGFAGLAAGTLLFFPVAMSVADATRGGCDGYGCMGNGMIGVAAGMGVLIALPVLGIKLGTAIDLDRASKPEAVGIRLIIPLDSWAYGTKVASRNPPEAIASTCPLDVTNSVSTWGSY